MNHQAAKDFEKADADLNKTYEALLNKLPDAESKQKLKESNEHGFHSETPKQRSRPIRRGAAR